MARYVARYCWIILPICLIAGIALALGVHNRGNPATLLVTVDHGTLSADGYAQARVHVQSTDGRELRSVAWQVENGRSLAEFEQYDDAARLRAGVTPGDVTLVVSARDLAPARLEIKLNLDPTDQFGDGTPDFLRLQDVEDQLAFRRWFTFLAESPYTEKEVDRRAEIIDCAALIRFAYREALRRHDAAWANHWHFSSLPHESSIQKYDYPHTALGTGLFRIRTGAFTPQDASNGAFAEFADAETLRRYNTHLVSRDISAALPGDLLFFRQTGHRMPFHTMIFLGRSYFEEGTDWLIYHTGPNSGHAGEIRRVAIGDLQQHPQVVWRPLPQNPAFLGVYRWNILREAD